MNFPNLGDLFVASESFFSGLPAVISGILFTIGSFTLLIRFALKRQSKVNGGVMGQMRVHDCRLIDR